MPSIRSRAALAATLAFVGLAGTAPAALGQAGTATKKAAPAPPATPGGKIKGPKGFQVDLIYSVPRESQGSWVNLAVDPRGRLIASDQYGKLYRVTTPPAAGPAAEVKVEPIPVELGEAQGLLWAFDSLYVVVNATGKGRSGLYRVRDTDGDDVLDKVDQLLKLEGNSEHGPHAVVLGPDGKSLYVIAGNATRLPELAGSLVPRVWGEDNLLPRMPDGRGFMADEKAPGGYIVRVDPEGKGCTLVSMGYRNAFDMAFNRAGDLFTYDSDMEWDVNTPWYRPTRVCLSAPGSDFGYRGGSGKWPAYYPDSLPPVVNIGPGSPTGVAFGYGAKFPARYQDALFLCDWSYGKLYALHLKPEGSAYTADIEEFLSGTPLPLTDLVINPKDGALYFAIGGRKTTSGLYRVTYAGGESTAPAEARPPLDERLALRRRIEASAGVKDPGIVDVAWACLANDDRFIRSAARVALEFQDPAAWRERALAEADPGTAIGALLALVRVGASDPAHRGPADPAPDRALGLRVLESLGRIDWEKLTYARKLDLIRVYGVLFHRFGPPDDATAARLAALFLGRIPKQGRELTIELCNLLVYLRSPEVAPRMIALMEGASTQEEQIDYARSLRLLRAGWTPGLRRAYFSWFARAADFRGGASLQGFLTIIRNDAIASLSASEKAELKPILDAPPAARSAAAPAAPARRFVKAYTVEELVPVVDEGLKHRRDFDRGRTLFAAGSCFACHRYDNEGGSTGPDLTGVSGRFSTRDLLESIILPSKVISDQYGAVTIATSDGKVVTGRIMNLNNDTIMLNTNMLDPSAQVTIDARRIEETRPSPTSMMPEGLLSTLDPEEVVDLVAYLLSRGDRGAKLFR